MTFHDNDGCSMIFHYGYEWDPIPYEYLYIYIYIGELASGHFLAYGVEMVHLVRWFFF